MTLILFHQNNTQTAALGVGEDDAVPPPKAGDDGPSSSLGSVLDDLDLLVDF